ncbi:MAG: MATE family efflux transporter, partial [Oscillospiraceae bacterium]
MQNNLITEKHCDKIFYKECFTIAIPIIIQNFFVSSLNLVDTVMVGQLGETPIAAVGVSNQIFFLMNFLLIGISAGCGIFITQFNGKNDVQGMRHSLGISLCLSLVLSSVFLFCGIFIPAQVVGLFDRSPDFISQTTSYLQIVCMSYPFVAITAAYSNALKNTGKTFYSMVSSTIAILTNIFLNAILIFGLFGFPRLGIRGAAIATLIARILETSILLSFVYFKKTIFRTSFKNILSFDKPFFKMLSIPILHTVGSEAVWAFGVVAFSIAYGKMGTDSLAVIQIYNVMQNLFSIMIYGVSNSAMVFVGRELGRGNKENAIYYARKLFKIGVTIAIILSIIMVIAIKYVVVFFNISAKLKISAIKTICVVAIPLICFAINTILI